MNAKRIIPGGVVAGGVIVIGESVGGHNRRPGRDEDATPLGDSHARRELALCGSCTRVRLASVPDEDAITSASSYPRRYAFHSRMTLQRRSFEALVATIIWTP